MSAKRNNVMCGMAVSPPPAGHESCSSLVCLQVRRGSNAAQVKGPKPPPGSLRSSAITSLVRDSQTASFNAARLLKSEDEDFCVEHREERNHGKHGGRRNQPTTHHS